MSIISGILPANNACDIKNKQLSNPVRNATSGYKIGLVCIYYSFCCVTIVTKKHLPLKLTILHPDAFYI